MGHGERRGCTHAHSTAEVPTITARPAHASSLYTTYSAPRNRNDGRGGGGGGACKPWRVALLLSLVVLEALPEVVEVLGVESTRVCTLPATL